jgi:hypothetical protein
VAALSLRYGCVQGQVVPESRRPHDAQRERVRTSSRFFAVPARTISHAAHEITTIDCPAVSCIMRRLACHPASRKNPDERRAVWQRGKR